MQPPNILPPGLQIIHDFITPAEEATLMTEIDRMSWSDILKRRTQHYGYDYGYKSKNLTKTDPIPPWCDFLWDKLRQANLLMPGKTQPDQLIVNEYEPGQGISAHTDAAIFGDVIVSLSLGSLCTMMFTHSDGRKYEAVLPRRSLVVMRGEAHTKWKHGIPSRKSDVVDGTKLVRGRRVSLTFRYV